MEKTVSVIIPFYNVEKYAYDCIDSVISQTYRDLQIILVDDGSPDRCGEICDGYAEKDGRITVIHKENGGLSDARNAGIEAARGDYITFVDSDDMIDRRYTEVLVKTIEDYDADVVQVEYTYYFKDLGTKRPDVAQEPVVMTGDDAFRSLLRRREANEAACAKIYRRHLFEEIRFPVGRINEDTLTTYKYLLGSRTVVFLPDYLYFYRYNNTGILHGRFTEKRFSFLSVFDEIDTWLGDRIEAFREDLLYYRMRRLIFFYNQCLALGADRDFPERVARVRSDILSYKDHFCLLDRKYGILVRILKTSPSLYRFLVLHMRAKERENKDALVVQNTGNN